ncbi:MAG TPA: GtrA family protein [Micrococcales bacterium]|nr:GtrA family protein [Micrococcales bacterium]
MSTQAPPPAATPPLVPSTPARIARALRQFVKFGLVGGAGVGVNMAVAVVMNKANGGTANAQDVLFAIPGTDFNVRFTSLVWIVGFLVANLFNFQLNRSWTFQSANRAPWLQEFGPFLLVGSVAAFVGLFLKVALTNPTSPIYLASDWFHEDAGLHSREYWAQLITIVVTMPVNFLVNKLWTFRHVRNRHLARVEEIERTKAA